MLKHEELRDELEKSRNELAIFLKDEAYGETEFRVLRNAINALNAGISFIDDIADTEEDARFERNTREQ